jgi:hypothetical protein
MIMLTVTCTLFVVRFGGAHVRPIIPGTKPKGGMAVVHHMEFEYLVLDSHYPELITIV